MPVTADKAENLRTARSYLQKAAEQGADLAILPEMFCCPYSNASFRENAEPAGGLVWQTMSQAAKEFGLWLVAGSMPEQDGDRLYNTSFVFDPEGKQVARHRKMHLFDICVKDGQQFKESVTFSAGDDVTVFDTPFGKLGLCICFDMRFPELSRMMTLQGVQAILAPAAFNMTTGPAHWELLFRQRAVDNQCFTIGVSPARDVSTCYVAYGNSLAVDPWGSLLTRADGEETILYADLDLSKVDSVRQQLPILSARRTDLYEVSER
jgi:predicted amidohydrolase